MTNPRIYIPGLPKTFANIDLEATAKYKNRPIPTEQEFNEILNKAEALPIEYFQLRAKAIIGLSKIFGKRKAELSLLEKSDILINGEYLEISFTICKKHKHGFFQFIEYLEKEKDANALNKTLPELREEYKQWILTGAGCNFKSLKRPKKTPLSDKYAQLVLDYYNYLSTTYPNVKYFFPSGKTVFGNYAINNNKALTGRQLLNIVKELDPNIWLHLFRKGKGSEVARKYGRTLDSVFNVASTLDVTQQTAWHYVENHAPKIETGETTFE